MAPRSTGSRPLAVVSAHPRSAPPSVLSLLRIAAVVILVSLAMLLVEALWAGR